MPRSVASFLSVKSESSFSVYNHAIPINMILFMLYVHRFMYKSYKSKYDENDLSNLIYLGFFFIFD